MFTPFRLDGSLDLDGAANLVQYLSSSDQEPEPYAGRVDGIFVRSGLGQMYTFSVEETLALARAALEAAAGKVPVLVGAAGEWNGDPSNRPNGKRYTEQSIALASEALSLGAAAAVLVLPWALSPAPGEAVEELLFNYFSRITASVHGPILIYQPPGVPPEYKITPSLMKRLLALPALRGMKLSVSTSEQFAPIAGAVKGHPFSLIAGDEAFFLGALRLGASGVIGQGCSTYPEILRAVAHYHAAGDVAAAEDAQRAVHIALEATRGMNAALISKQVLISRGICMEPYNRGEVEPYPPDVVARVAAALDECIAPYYEHRPG
jgi:4-hydroxy-tetrahydrodipicolinate synthase